MASNLKNLSEYDINSIPNGENMKFGIVVSEYYNDITNKLLDACLDTFSKQNVKQKNIKIIYAPGTYELPSACEILNSKFDADAIIAFGCVIKGDTDHDKYINMAVANALQNLMIKYSKPFLFGVLTPNTMQQAIDRSGGKHGNKGVEVANAALKIVALKM